MAVGFVCLVVGASLLGWYVFQVVQISRELDRIKEELERMRKVK